MDCEMIPAAPITTRITFDIHDTYAVFLMESLYVFKSFRFSFIDHISVSRYWDSY